MEIEYDGHTEQFNSDGERFSVTAHWDVRLDLGDETATKSHHVVYRRVDHREWVFDTHRPPDPIDRAATYWTLTDVRDRSDEWFREQFDGTLVTYYPAARSD